MMQAEEYLEKIPMWTREKHSLTDIRAFLHEMGDPDRKLSIIHVAGTNGKALCAPFLPLCTEMPVFAPEPLSLLIW